MIHAAAHARDEAEPPDPEVENLSPERRAAIVAEHDRGRGARPPAPEGASAPLVRQTMPARLGDLIGPSCAVFDARRRGEDPYVVTPWPRVNAALGGGYRPGVHFIIGGTGVGKTQFALQAALWAAGWRGTRDGRVDLVPHPHKNPAHRRVPVVYIGAEMGPDDVTARILGLLGGAPWSALYRDGLWDGAVPLDVAKAAAAELPFYVETAPPKAFDHSAIEPLVARVRREHPRAECPNVVVVVDYLQILGGEERDLRERIGSAAAALIGVKQEHSAVVLALSSTARASYGALQGRRETAREPEPWKRPAEWFVGLGKESGEVEFCGDSVCAMVREPWPTASGPLPGGTRVHLAFAKVRTRGPSWCRLLFDGHGFREPPPEGEPLDGAPFAWDAPTPVGDGPEDTKTGRGKGKRAKKGEAASKPKAAAAGRPGLGGWTGDDAD